LVHQPGIGKDGEFLFAMKIIKQETGRGFESMFGYDNPDLASVIIPTFNHEKYIRDALDSVIGQDWHPLEIVLIDDGSTDNTFEAGLDCLRASKVPFVAIKKENQGSCVSALNNGIGLSHGEYVSVLSGDDIYYPHKLLASISALKSSGADLAYGDSQTIREDGRVITSDGNVFEITRQHYERGDLFRCMLSGIGAGFAYIGITFTRGGFDKIGLYDPMIFTEDLDMSLRIAMHGMKIEFLRKPVGAHRVVATSLSRTVKAYDCTERILRKYAPSFWSIAKSLSLIKLNKGADMLRSGEWAGIGHVLSGILGYPPNIAILLRRSAVYMLKSGGRQRGHA
jgi:glycosyltransferase involved in cell wall biosynthesis